jgi:hypothetical protein
LQQLGDDPDLDGARIQFLREAGRREPEIALESIATLSKPADQEKYYRDILRNWSRDDKDAAVSWAIENSNSLPGHVVNSVVPKNLRPQ